MIKALCSLSLAFLLLPSPAQAQQLRSLHLNTFREEPASVIGRLKGFFAAEGLEVKIKIADSSTEQMQGLSNGTYQLATGSFDNVLGWSGREGVELIAVAQSGDSTFFPIYVRPEIKNWSDLRGKKLAVDAPDTAFALVLRRVLLDQGLDLTKGDYQFAAVGGPAQRIASMKQGDTFASATTIGATEAALAAAGMVRLGDSKASLPDFPFSVYASTRDWAQKERAQLVGFLRAWLASMRWIRANREEASKLMQAELKIDAKVAAIQIDAMPRTGEISLAGLEAILQLRNQFKLTPPLGPNVSRYYDTRYYDAAAAR